MKKLIVILGFLLITVPAFANDGLYLGAGLLVDHYSGLGPLYMVPGGNLKVGYDFGLFALEVNIMQDTHDDKLLGYGAGSTGFSGTSKFNGKSIDIRIPLTSTSHGKNVYGLVGVGAYTLVGPDPTIHEEVNYSGIGYNLGLGFERYMSQHIAFNLAAIYHTIRFDKKESLGITTTLSPKLSDDLLSVEIGFNYHF